MKVSFAQIQPTWLNKTATIEKVVSYIKLAANEGASLVAFGETVLPGYPFWVELTDGARFESDVQKDIYAHYSKEAIAIKTDLEELKKVCRENNIAAYIGVLERGVDRGGQSVYCTLVYIDQQGVIRSTHRKLMPTYEERLVWAIGDGNGLQVHDLGEFKVGGLNCWENWMPLARTALTAQGETLHIATWPGNLRNTVDLTRHMALESRSYVISVSGLMNRNAIEDNVPHADLIRSNTNRTWLANGGSCIAGPDGEWVVPPIVEREELVTVNININEVRRARHNFDPVGHYSRPDVLKLSVNRERQKIIHFE